MIFSFQFHFFEQVNCEICFRFFGKIKYDEIITYVLTLINGVDLNFRTMTEPKVRLNIAGFIIDRVYKNIIFRVP